MVEPVAIAADRSMAVPPGCLVRTGYVPVEQVTMACRDRMAIGDVKTSFERLLQLGGHQPWPCPRGHWAGDRFVVVDGRHQFVASLMLGLSHLLVAWVDAPAGAAASGGAASEAPGDPPPDGSFPGRV